MKKLNEKIAQYNAVVDEIEGWLDAFDEAGNADNIIEEAIEHIKNLKRVTSWDCHGYLASHYYKPFVKELLKPFLDKWVVYKKEVRVWWIYNRAWEDFISYFYKTCVLDANHCWCGTANYELSKEKNGKQMLEDCRKEASVYLEKHKANKRVYLKRLREIENHIKGLYDYYCESTKRPVWEHLQRLNDIVEYIRARKKFLTHKK